MFSGTPFTARTKLEGHAVRAMYACCGATDYYLETGDPAYWKRIHANGGYKTHIADQIADPWWNGDPDWALLVQTPWGEVWFDIEEGVKLFVAAAGSSGCRWQTQDFYRLHASTLG